MELPWSMEMALEAAGTRRAEEAEFVRAAKHGDEQAFEELVRLHQHRVFRLAGRFFGRREDIEDAAQETFLTAWRKLDTYRAQAPFEHWLTRVCLNCCYQKIRQERRVAANSELPAETAAPGHDPNAAIEVERLLEALAPADRFVLLLLDGEGWSVAEIAERLGWSRVNVKVRAHRARKSLRKLLERPS